jgi:hypothetical protein
MYKIVKIEKLPFKLWTNQDFNHDDEAILFKAPSSEKLLGIIINKA